jgi:tRNA A37 methylthiotransferase MiaB
MATFSIENFGCRATDADAASIRGGLVKNGLQMVESHAAADFVVLNTCTVTGAADSQAREAIRKIHRANPAARILVTGCYAQRVPEELAALPWSRGWLAIRTRGRFLAWCASRELRFLWATEGTTFSSQSARERSPARLTLLAFRRFAAKVILGHARPPGFSAATSLS